MKTVREEHPIDIAALTHAHVGLVQVESELWNAGRLEAARALAVADLVVLNLRHFLVAGPHVESDEQKGGTNRDRDGRLRLRAAQEGACGNPIRSSP